MQHAAGKTGEALAPGTAVAGLRIERLLARGGSGTLYVAHDLRTRQARALKLFAPPGDDAAAAFAASRHATEVALLRRLRHPAIVEIVDAGIDAGRPYLVMPLLPGADLRRHTEAAHRLPADAVLALGADAAEALSHAHAHGIVHRDVKPANLVYDPATRRVWVTDFGAARLTGAERTRTGVLLGTPSFMPPEQLAGGTPTPAGDVHALAVTLFQLLTGTLPYEGATLGALLLAMARGTAQRLRALRPDLPPALEALLAQAMHREASQRPDAATFAARLRAPSAP